MGSIRGILDGPTLLTCSSTVDFFSVVTGGSDDVSFGSIATVETFAMALKFIVAVEEVSSYRGATIRNGDGCMMGSPE